MHGFAFGSEPRSSNPCVAHAGPEEQLQNLMGRLSGMGETWHFDNVKHRKKGKRNTSRRLY